MPPRAAAHRADRNTPDDETLEELADETANQLLPYRAGYESEDRNRIQQALSSGQLRGVVSTSALELGLDIGEVNVVVLLTPPPSMKAFWQRIGRAGRKFEGQCLMLDTVGMASARPGGIRDYLKRPIEPNWLYLPNRFIQYTNALCAVQEREDAGDIYNSEHFVTLPESFGKFVQEELNPTQMLAADLFALRQRAQGPAPIMNSSCAAQWKKTLRLNVNKGRWAISPFRRFSGKPTLARCTTIWRVSKSVSN